MSASSPSGRLQDFFNRRIILNLDGFSVVVIGAIAIGVYIFAYVGIHTPPRPVVDQAQTIRTLLYGYDAAIYSALKVAQTDLAAAPNGASPEATLAPTARSVGEVCDTNLLNRINNVRNNKFFDPVIDGPLADALESACVGNLQTYNPASSATIDWRQQLNDQVTELETALIGAGSLPGAPYERLPNYQAPK